MREQVEKRLETLKEQRAQLAQALAESRQRTGQLEANVLQHDGAIVELEALLKVEGEPGEEVGGPAAIVDMK